MKTEKDVIAFREFNTRANIFKSRNLERNGALVKRKFNVPVRMQIYNPLEFLSPSFFLSLYIYIYIYIYYSRETIPVVTKRDTIHEN